MNTTGWGHNPIFPKISFSSGSLIGAASALARLSTRIPFGLDARRDLDIPYALQPYRAASGPPTNNRRSDRRASAFEPHPRRSGRRTTWS